jgi:RNA polymerase sigma-70 factor (ECF subfamily)
MGKLTALLSPLTPEEQKYAEENHDLVYKFLHMHNLNVDDYYDVIIFGYLRAVENYSKRPDLQKLKFTTVAYAAMGSEWKNYSRAQNAEKRKGNALSLDCTTIYGEDDLELYNIIGKHDALDEEEALNRILKELAPVLTKKQLKALHLKAQGYSYNEINSEYKLSFNVITRAIKESREPIHYILSEMTALCGGERAMTV